MSWRETSVEEERLKFIQEALNLNTKHTFEEVCEKYNIAPKTGYKWFKRFLSEGLTRLTVKASGFNFLSSINVLAFNIRLAHEF